ncbi:MAG: superoxide dismutase family protein [Gemmatimonadetes bacterium]|nr:superoxide dismutase family protein [Gemmatimonadota bacterium]
MAGACARGGPAEREAPRPAPPPPPARATAILRDGENRIVGRALATAQAGGVRMTIEATALPPGRHGVHVHAVGRCEAPGFASAGPHFNPAQRAHGLENPAGPHAGDLPNLDVDATGAGTLVASTDRFTLTAENALLDADGSAVVVHAGPDDQRSDPAGNSGTRIACGVLAPAPGG